MTTLNLPIQLNKLDTYEGRKWIEREAQLWEELLTAHEKETSQQAKIRQVAERIRHNLALRTGRISG